MLLTIIVLSAICTGIFFLIKQLVLCCEYEEWKKAYIPVSNELDEVIERVKFIQSLDNPSSALAREYIKDFARMKMLGKELDRLWAINPRRQ